MDVSDRSPTQNRTCIAIAAIDKNRAIAKGNDIPWHLPDDFKHFKRTTAGHTVIMGRKTAETLPFALPSRTNIVISRQQGWRCDGFIRVGSLEEALSSSPPGQLCFIIGGGEIYRQAMPLCHTLILTQVDCVSDGDVFFPAWAEEDWELAETQHHPVDEKHRHPFDINTYRHKGLS